MKQLPMKQKLFPALLFTLLFTFTLTLVVPVKAATRDKYVVVLSMDAFRWDYPHKYNTPTLDSLANSGVTSRFIPCFPSLTFPNHYSMATGLHPDRHGIVHNAFYDAELKKEYRIANREAVADPDFYAGEPIWVTAEQQGVRTASFFWVGSETKIKGIQPTDWKKFTSKIDFQSRADSVISWLQRPEESRPHLIMWYFEEPDAISHATTPDSKETRAMIEGLDALLGRFFESARQLAIFPQIDFILVGDHGMSTYYPERYVNLADYLPIDKFEHLASGPVINLYPKPEYVDSAYRVLKEVPHLNVWRKGEIPARFDYGKNKRVGELVVLAEPGTIIHFSEKRNPKLGAAHGYDPAFPEMHAIFYGTGPSFKQGFQQQPMLNVNLYPLIAELLGLDPAPNDGDPELIRKMLRKE